MTSRERVLLALNHREADRIPVDLSGHRSSGISAIAYPKLRAALGLPPKTVYVYDPVQQLAIVDEDVLDRFGADAIEMGRGFCLDEKWWADWTLPDGTPCKMPIWALPEKSGEEWVFRAKRGACWAACPKDRCISTRSTGPCSTAKKTWPIWTPAMRRTCGPPSLRRPDRPLRPTRNSPRAPARCARRPTAPIVGLFGGNLLEIGQMYYRMDNFLMMLAGEPQRAHGFLDALVESIWRSSNGASPPWAHTSTSSSSATTSARRTARRSRRACTASSSSRATSACGTRAKKLAPVKVMLHCCGAVRQLLPDLIDAGLDAINPVQISCRGMEAAGLKRDFGTDLTFWGGGCDTQQMLPEATPDEIRDARAGAGGNHGAGRRLRLPAGAQHLANVPAENIIAMYDAVREFQGLKVGTN